jgi:hypothetical protein
MENTGFAVGTFPGQGNVAVFHIKGSSGLYQFPYPLRSLPDQYIYCFYVAKASSCFQSVLQMQKGGILLMNCSSNPSLS